MVRSVEEIAADFDVLTPLDFDYANAQAGSWERVDKLCDEIRAVDDPKACASVLFRTTERLECMSIGTPGSLVHKLESWRGAYEAPLADSVSRKPVPLTVWMVNRILNAGPPDAGRWLGLPRDVADNPAASAESKAEAARFLDYQTGLTHRRSAPGAR